MLILLDENLLSRKLKQPLIVVGHTVSNVDEMGWRGYKDRQILEMAAAQPFDLFITADKNLPFQQNLNAYDIQILVLDVSSTKPSYLLPLMIQLSSQPIDEPVVPLKKIASFEFRFTIVSRSRFQSFCGGESLVPSYHSQSAAIPAGFESNPLLVAADDADVLFQWAD